MKIIVGISGASGIVYGLRLMEVLADYGSETHLVMTRWAKENLSLETECSLSYVESLVSVRYEETDMSAAIASGSFSTDAMVIVPCSMRSLAAIAHGCGNSLLHRAADVMLKERKKMIIVPRETPLSAIHLENMLALARLGVVIMPPMPAFYHKPTSIADIIDHHVGRILDQLGIENTLTKRWLR